MRLAYAAALRAVAPGAALTRALSGVAPPRTAPIVLAIGKAAPAMAEACVAWLAGHGLAPAGGLIVAQEPTRSPSPALATMLGDHPVPGARSLAAAEALGNLVRDLAPGTPVEVLLSGGTSALIGAPMPGGDPREYARRVSRLLGSGLDITEVNAERRRLGRWTAGRLGAALGDRPVRVWLLSDVPGDDLATIGSGPLVPDPARAPRIPHRVIASGREALDGAAGAWGGDVLRHGEPLAGEAAEQARTIVGTLMATRPAVPTLHLWAGETTVTLPPAPGQGGRSQQLALAAAGAMVSRPPGAPEITILAAGTDGQDGNAPAAGAIVDGATWERILARGGDPAGALARCDAFPALRLADALIVTGATGTNVADLVLALAVPAGG